jgi:protein-S-isoprenylcysteine O-methyltransferase Ste14
MPSPMPLPSQPTWRWLLATAFLILVAHEGHELIHTGVGRVICGAWGSRDFNVWSLAEGCESWVPTLMGPLFSWALMWIGVSFLRSDNEVRRWTGLSFIFAPNPLGRLLPALLGGGDEGVVARHFLGNEGPWARLAVIAVSVTIILPCLVAAWKALPERRRPLWFFLLFILGILVTGPLFLVLGNRMLAQGIMTEPGIMGAPQLVELFTLLSVVGLVATWTRMLPPVILLFAITIALELSALLPGPRFGGGAMEVVGGAIALAGLALMVYSAGLFRRRGTGVRPFTETTLLVVEGPYRFTRNPMYLGMTLMLTGIGLVLGALVPLVTVPLFMAIITTRYIAKEEQLLAAQFGSSYQAYRARVRRWL